MNRVKEKILSERLIVIVRGVGKDKLIPLAEALYAGGVRLTEITYGAGTPDGETAEGIRSLCEHMNGRMDIGAGTVLSELQVRLTAEAGGKFIISPNTNKDVIEATREAGLVSVPAGLTPTEIEAAYEYGADFVKLFPAAEMGPSYVKAVRAPLPHVPLLAVGGIDLCSLADYAKAGVCGFGIGGSIVDRKLIDAGDFEAIARLAEKYVSAVRELF